jgi:hypothetical protein
MQQSIDVVVKKKLAEDVVEPLEHTDELPLLNRLLARELADTRVTLPELLTVTILASGASLLLGYGIGFRRRINPNAFPPKRLAEFPPLVEPAAKRAKPTSTAGNTQHYAPFD